MFNIIHLENVKDDLVEIVDCEKIKRWNGGPDLRPISFAYRRVLRPHTDTPTKQWNIFVKEAEKQSEYRPISGTLSNNYSIVKTEDVVFYIQNQLNSKFIRDPLYRQGKGSRLTEMYISFMLDSYTGKFETDSVTNKMIFALMSDINVDELESRCALSFNITNSLKGSRSLTLNYGFCTLHKPKSGQIKSLAINNTILLNEFTVEARHDNRLEVNLEGVSKIFNGIQDRIDLYKSIQINETFMKFFFDFRGPKTILDNISDKWQKIDDQWRNLYYFTQVVCYITGLHDDIEFEVKLRNYITRGFVIPYIQQMNKKQEKMKIAATS